MPAKSDEKRHCMPDSDRIGKVQGLNAGGQDLEPGPVSPQPFLYSLELRAVDEPASIPGERLWPIIVRIEFVYGEAKVACGDKPD